MNHSLLSLQDVTKQYRNFSRSLFAVNKVSFSILPGEIMGLAGESGCGKSTLAKLILRITNCTSGSIFFEGKNISHLSSKALRPLRRQIQMIFQNPSNSINPKMTVEEILKEPYEIHQLPSRSRYREEIIQLLHQVGLDPIYLKRFPHELSGGQKQRVNIARALALNPRLLVCDESLSALDGSVQVQIINLLKHLQQQHRLTYLFISHDLSVMRYLADRITVMYAGQLMELAPSNDLYQTPLHPYTQALLSAIPFPDPKVERSRSRIVLSGEIPSPFSLPSGCPFASRCPFAMPICKNTKPLWKEARFGHFVACHLY